MRISIITVSYNSESTIKDTLDSVLSQTYGELGLIEHIIVDGGSKDSTAQIIKEYESKYCYRASKALGEDNDTGHQIKWISEPDRGLYDAMNKGIHMATGDVIGILNSDDFYADDRALLSIAEKFNETDCDVVYGNIIFVDQHDTSLVKRTWISGTGNFYLGWCPPHPALYLKKGVYEKLGDYRADFRNVSDYDYLVRIFIKHPELKVAYLNKILVHMRMGGESTRGMKSHILSFKEIQISLKSYNIKFPTIINILRFTRKIGQLKKNSIKR